MTAEATLVKRALDNDRAAWRELILHLTPVVRHRVARVLALHAARRGRSPSREDVLDMLHDVFVLLLDRGGRVLETWQPARGLSLQNFVGLVAEREASAILRSGRRSAWAERPTHDDVLAREPGPRTPEHRVAAREQLELTLDRLTSRLSPRGLLLFEALYTESQSVDEVCAKFEMTPNAVYTFKNRLKNLLEEVKAELGPPSAPPDSARLAPHAFGAARSPTTNSESHG